MKIIDSNGHDWNLFGAITSAISAVTASASSAASAMVSALSAVPPLTLSLANTIASMVTAGASQLVDAAQRVAQATVAGASQAALSALNAAQSAYSSTLTSITTSAPTTATNNRYFSAPPANAAASSSAVPSQAPRLLSPVVRTTKGEVGAIEVTVVLGLLGVAAFGAAVIVSRVPLLGTPLYAVLEGTGAGLISGAVAAGIYTWNYGPDATREGAFDAAGNSPGGGAAKGLLGWLSKF